MQQYARKDTVEADDLKYYVCRRKFLGKELGHYPCTSSFSIHPTFSRKNELTIDEVKSLPEDEIPYSIVGLFHHAHENDEKYHKDKQGNYKVIKSNPAKKKY